MEIKFLSVFENDTRSRISKWMFLPNTRKCFRYDSDGIVNEIDYKKGMKICKRLCKNNTDEKIYHLEGNFINGILEDKKTDELLKTLQNGEKIILGVH